ncbi:hypothetical protein FACS189454_08570 [Planctomycetales bacterium]|nr:hypothetical protein FACS189454_08570 [Planctomycetales bacterium]
MRYAKEQTETEVKKMTMKTLNRITFNPAVMGGKPCIRGMRITAGMLVGLVASGNTVREILDAYPYIEEEDIEQALTYAAWRTEEMEYPLEETPIISNEVFA